MGFTAIAVVFGLVIGIVTGGRLVHLGEHRFRLWPLLVAGVVLQLPVLDRLGFGGLLLSYAFLLGFAVANLRYVGMALVMIGITLNVVTIALNRGMPVRRDAIVQAGMYPRSAVDDLHLDRKHHLERPGDRVMFLSDIVPLPVPELRSVLSMGDLVMSIGVADILVHLLRPARRRRKAHAHSATT